MYAVYMYTGFYSSFSYLFAAPFQKQASLLYIEDDNAMLEVDDKLLTPLQLHSFVSYPFCTHPPLTAPTEQICALFILASRCAVLAPALSRKIPEE